MPLYEYECTECGNIVEKVRHYIETDIMLECSECQKSTEHTRKMSAPAFKVKGGHSEKMKVR